MSQTSRSNADRTWISHHVSRGWRSKENVLNWSSLLAHPLGGRFSLGDPPRTAAAPGSRFRRPLRARASRPHPPPRRPVPVRPPSTSTVWMHAIRRDLSTPTCFPAAPMASGMAAVMLKKQPELWDRVWTASCPSIIVKRCSGPTLECLRMEAQMGENGGRTTGQLLSYGLCACLAWRFMSLAHIHRVGTAGLDVAADGNGHCTESTKNKGKYTINKG